MLENRFSPTFRDSQMTTKNTVILAQILAHALDFASSIAGLFDCWPRNVAIAQDLTAITESKCGDRSHVDSVRPHPERK